MPVAESPLTPGTTTELYAALNRRLRIVEGRPQMPKGLVRSKPNRLPQNGSTSVAPPPRSVVWHAAAPKISGGGVGSLRQQTRAAMELMEAQVDAIRQQHTVALEELSGRCSQEMLKREEMAIEIQRMKRQRGPQPELTEREQQTEIELADRVQQTEIEARSAQVAAMESPPSAEGILRSAMTRTDVTTEELQVAVEAVEALVTEAKRELQNRRFRERRAAFERLHAAISRGDEAVLAAALVEARRTDVEEEDIAMGTAALHELQALTEEQRAAKALRECEAENKSRAFLLVKRDNVAGLQELVANLDSAGMQWQGWKDHAGRTLLQCAYNLRSAKAQLFLEPLMKPVTPVRVERKTFTPEHSPGSGMTLHFSGSCPTLLGSRQKSAKKFIEASVVVECCTVQEPCEPAPETTPEVASPVFEEVPASVHDEAALKLAAFRAVVKDDTATLGEILDSKVPLSIWRRWENKVGKDLLMLSEERGSTAAYSMIAKALGILKERRRDSFEEREAVWVMLAGEVQPMRATVLEDTPEEAQDVFVEFWEGCDPPARVVRDIVFKITN